MPNSAFIDPRHSPSPPAVSLAARTTDNPEELRELQRLCKEGRIYAVERWIDSGAPLQIAPGTPIRPRRDASALRIALEGGHHDLLLLLLCNGYDPNMEESSPLDLALRSRRSDIVELLLTWGSDPKQVQPDAVFDTYDLSTIERFWALGSDYTDGHALACYLGEHTSNKPLWGWTKRHAPDNPQIQRQLDMALGEHVHEGREKGVLLSLWSGADPHAYVPPLRYVGRGWCDGDDDESHDQHHHHDHHADDHGHHQDHHHHEDEGHGAHDHPRVQDGREQRQQRRDAGWCSAVEEACMSDHQDLLRRLKPDPARDDFQELYRAAGSPSIVETLAEAGPAPSDPSLIPHHIHRTTWPWASWSSRSTLQALVRHGARWSRYDADEIASVRRSLLKAPDSEFVELVRLLALEGAASPGVLQELARAQSMRARLKKVGFFPTDANDRDRAYPLRPRHARQVLTALGITIPKPRRKPVLWRSVQIGRRRHGAEQVRITRSELYDHVWRQPISELAPTWGLSGRGLAKACRRVQVPVPPRGYWARVAAGQKVRRPRLPVLPEGQAGEIVVWIPSP